MSTKTKGVNVPKCRIVIPRGWFQLKAGTPLIPGDCYFVFRWEEMKPPHWTPNTHKGCLTQKYYPAIRRIRTPSTQRPTP